MIIWQDKKQFHINFRFSKILKFQSVMIIWQDKKIIY